jgi:hypothetical protein
MSVVKMSETVPALARAPPQMRDRGRMWYNGQTLCHHDDHGEMEFGAISSDSSESLAKPDYRQPT